MPWRSWRNAEIYDRSVRERPIYQWLNRHLVDRARLPGTARVLDLGCGTGATTVACLERMGARSEIVGIDSSASRSGGRRPRSASAPEGRQAGGAGTGRRDAAHVRARAGSISWAEDRRSSVAGGLDK